MPEFKIVINDVKTGKSYQKVLHDENLLGKKIKDTVEGNMLGLPGYELEITGGSDTAGFPMREDLDTPARKRVLLTHGVGLRESKKGAKIRKMVRGNTIMNTTSQISMKVTKYGSKSIPELFGIAQEQPASTHAAQTKVAPQKEAKV